MTMVLEAEATRAAERSARDAERMQTERFEVDAALEEIIAAHRAALRELAPHQAARWVRRETAWHITHLGLLLRLKETQILGATAQHKAAPGMVPNQERPQESAGPDRCTR